MREATHHSSVASVTDADGLAAAAAQAEAWAGEPFLRPDEDPALVLAEGQARRRALDAALAEMAEGRRSPSAAWRVNYALMLGLERVLAADTPHLASGTELRRHQIDALAGMLTELIARNEVAIENGNGPAAADQEPPDEDDEPDELDDELEAEEPDLPEEDPGRRAPLPLPPPDGLGQDDRRCGLPRSSRDDGRPHPHPPPAARQPVHAAISRRGVR